MKRKLLILSMLVGMTFFWLPVDSTVSAQNRQTKERRNGNPGGNRQQIWQGDSHHNGPKWNHGYKNYGQYRRTQVGNRRYRSVRRAYWTNGSRFYRWVRIYY